MTKNALVVKYLLAQLYRFSTHWQSSTNVYTLLWHEICYLKAVGTTLGFNFGFIKKGARMKYTKSSMTVLLGLGLLLGTGCAHMHGHGHQCEIKEKVHVAGEAQVSADQAIQTALQKVQGTVVEAELEEEKDHTVIWEVEIVTADSKLMGVKIDGKTGEVLKVKEEKAE